jgi:hypothetical protein
MPIHVPITFPRLSEAEMLEVDYDVMKHAFACHRELGRLCDELNYQADLAVRLLEAGFDTILREMPVTVTFCGFEVSLYLQAITWHLGGEEKVDRLLPLQRGNTKLAAQRFHLINDSEAFAISAFPFSSMRRQQKHLQTLLELSPLKSIHWINTTVHHLHLLTLTR